jgi:tRNA(Ser,Leu) C12 N-acetylase TAN1
MTQEQMERAIEFLLNAQAQNTADIGKLTADVQGLKEVQAQTSRDVMTLAAAVSELANTVARVETQMVEGFIRMEARMDRFEAQAESDRREMRESAAAADARMDRFEAQAESDRQEIREAVEKLITVSEDTRSFAIDIAKSTIETKQRATDLDRRVTDLESKL